MAVIFRRVFQNCTVRSSGVSRLHRKVGEGGVSGVNGGGGEKELGGVNEAGVWGRGVEGVGVKMSETICALFVC